MNSNNDDDHRRDLLAQIAAAVRELGCDPEDTLTREIAELRAAVTGLTASLALNHNNCCCHTHWHYWPYPGQCATTTTPAYTTNVTSSGIPYLTT